ncbi:amino acid ABC transporter substrate-binding protein [Blastochloris viridis]|nr:amino acid ABC transporter substrate-binding protein [Blastochloris viridis]BAS00154.1 amino acid ABC transporter [Blastochloris viridis]
MLGTTRHFGGFLLALAALALPTALSAGTLENVRQRGTLVCGVGQNLVGFSQRDEAGRWSGFDVDFCRAVAAAVLGDADKVSFVSLSATERFDALRAGKVDLLSRNSTWTLEREGGLGLLFAAITYHDGQGFLVIRKPAETSALELGDSKVCVQTGTTSQANLADFFRANSMSYSEVPVATQDEAAKALIEGRCDVMTTDHSALYALRLDLPNRAGVTILPDVISKESLGPVTRADDVAWFNVAKWVHFALVNAEELGVTSQNADAALTSSRPAVRRLVGAEGGLGKVLGLDDAWALRAVKAAGNYGEIYERNVGLKSRLGIPRGLNQLWSMGGILYAPPLQ